MKRYFLPVAAAVAALLAAGAFITDLRTVIRSDCIDLESRIAACRDLQQGLDPYFVRVEDGKLHATGISVTPAALLLQYPLSGAPYPGAKLAWLLLSWIFALAAIAIFAASQGEEKKRLGIWLVCLLFLGLSDSVRLHMERGQLYSLYLFLLALSFRFSVKTGGGKAGGALLGVLACVRPSMILVLFPMAFQNKWKMIGCALAAAAVTLAVSVSVTGVPAWQGYSAAMRELNALSAAGSYRGSPSLEYAAACEGNCRIEGRYADMRPTGYQKAFYYNDSSFKSMLAHFIPAISSRFVLAACAASVALFAVFLFHYRRKNFPVSLLFLTGSGIMLFAEHCIPYYRFNYGDMLWLMPFSLILACSRDALSLGLPRIALFCSAFLLSTILQWVRSATFLGEMLMLLFFLSCVVFLVKNQPAAAINK